MDSYLSLCYCSDCKKETENRTINQRNSTSFEHKHICIDQGNCNGKVFKETT